MITPRYIPSDYSLSVDRSDIEVMVYTSERAGVPYGLCFVGKGGKPFWNYRFRSVESRDAEIARTIAGQEASIARKKARKAERAKPTDVAVGDVFRSMWGYDQTNVDYYEVTRVISPSMVEVREIGCESVETAYMQGNSVPVKGMYIGEPMRKRVQSYEGGEPYFRVASYASATRMKPDVVAGVPVYKSTSWTAYA